MESFIDARLPYTADESMDATLFMVVEAGVSIFASRR